MMKPFHGTWVRKWVGAGVTFCCESHSPMSCTPRGWASPVVAAACALHIFIDLGFFSPFLLHDTLNR